MKIRDSVLPVLRPVGGEEEVNAIRECIESGWWGKGPKVAEFEKKFAEMVGAKYAVAVNSATSALHVACLALDLGVGDWLWTSPNTFVASANCALYCGARVDFVDIDPRTYNMSVECLKKKLEQAKKEDRLPKIVMPVHFAGQPSDMHSIFALSQQYGFKIIEDASHAFGAKFENEPIGSCKYSDITVFSFHPVKIMTTCEGGVCTTNNKRLFEK